MVTLTAHLKRLHRLIPTPEILYNQLLSKATPMLEVQAVSLQINPYAGDTNSCYLKQWLSTFFVLVHPLEFARKPVHPCHALQ